MADTGYTPPAGYVPVYASDGVTIIGYNPPSQDSGYQSLQGTVGGYSQTSGGGGLVGPTTTVPAQDYNSPVAFNPGSAGGYNQNGYIDFGPNYNPNPGAPGNSDYFYYDNYGEAVGAQDHGLGKISYGSAQTNSLVGTPGNGDPTINGIDYTQGASYASEYANGQGSYNPNYIAGSTFNPVTDSSTYLTPTTYSNGQSAPGTPTTIYGEDTADQLLAYTPTTEPGYTAPTATAAGPTGTQSYNPQGQPVSPASPTNTPEGFGTPGTFYYGDNGSAGSISGTFSNTTPGQASTFYQNEPGSLTNAPGQSGLGYAGANSAIAPTDSAQGYFSSGSNYSAIQNNNAQANLSGDYNGATGGINGANPLGLSLTDATGAINPLTAQVQTQNNPALQALTASRSLN